MSKKQPYYVIETSHVGNDDMGKHMDADTIEISTCPAITNSGRVERTEGWCGTTNDWSVHAHGAYSTIEDARAAITRKFGPVRDCDADGNSFEPDHEDVVALFKRGRYAPMGSEETHAWAIDGIKEDIQFDTDDRRIGELVSEYEREANGEGFTLSRDLEKFMKAHREALRDTEASEIVV